MWIILITVTTSLTTVAPIDLDTLGFLTSRNRKLIFVPLDLKTLAPLKTQETYGSSLPFTLWICLRLHCLDHQSWVLSKNPLREPVFSLSSVYQGNDFYHNFWRTRKWSMNLQTTSDSRDFLYFHFLLYRRPFHFLYIKCRLGTTLTSEKSTEWLTSYSCFQELKGLREGP